jgi:hypothetical protein
LVNRTKSGIVQTFDNLTFHGGPGQVLEMRLFSRNDLLQSFKHAGFEEVEISVPEPSPEFGICWPDPWSRGMVARKRPGPRRPVKALAHTNKLNAMSSKLKASLKNFYHR